MCKSKLELKWLIKAERSAKAKAINKMEKKTAEIWQFLKLDNPKIKNLFFKKVFFFFKLKKKI